MNWGNLADALYWIPDRRAEARPAYRKALALAQSQLEVNPKNATAAAYIAEYSAMLDEKDAAVENARRALTLAPDDPTVMVRVALVYNHFGDKKTALMWLQKAVKAGGSRPNIRDTPDFDDFRGDSDFQEAHEVTRRSDVNILVLLPTYRSEYQYRYLLLHKDFRCLSPHTYRFLFWQTSSRESRLCLRVSEH